MCLHPDCSHYIHKIYLRNKRAECYICHEPFVITPKLLGNGRVANLRCSTCRIGRITSKVKVLDYIQERLQRMIK